MSKSSLPSYIPLKKALLIIILSVVIVSGSSFLSVIYYNHLKERKKNDPKYQIVALVQTSPEAEGLKTVYLAELLELSIDIPTNLYAFNSQEAIKKLLASPVIKEATITKISPGTLWVDYSLRKPIAILGDYSNTMIDREGIPFPINPFFTPKRLPEIFLGKLEEEGAEDAGGEKKFVWGMKIEGKRLRLAAALLDFFNQHFSNGTTRLERIDVSKAFSLSYGQRQIALILEDSSEKMVNGKPLLCMYPKILRLDTDTYEVQLHHYKALSSHLRQNEILPPNSFSDEVFYANTMLIDLRIPDLAFMQSL
jgi:hypothetical protein